MDYDKIKFFRDYFISYDEFFVNFCGMNCDNLIEVDVRYICSEDICKGKVLIVKIPKRKCKFFLNLTYNEKFNSSDCYFDIDDLVRLRINISKFKKIVSKNNHCVCNYTSNQNFLDIDDHAIEFGNNLKRNQIKSKNRDSYKKNNRYKHKDRVKLLKLKRRSFEND